MAEILSLHDAVKQFVNDGDTVARRLHSPDPYGRRS
jgi:hypothetical protein